MPRRTPRALPADPAAALSILAGSADPTLVDRATSYRPRFPKDWWPTAAPFVTLGVVAAAPRSKEKTTETAQWCTRHVTACLDRGASRTVTGVWGVDAVEATLATVPLSTASGAAMATALRRASRALVAQPSTPHPTQHPRREPARPYTTGELADLVEAATVLGPELWRVRACLVIVLHAGAGLRPANLGGVDLSAVVIDDGGVRVPLPDGRVAVVRTELEDLAAATLRAALASPEPHRLLAVRHPSSTIVERTPWPHGLSRPNASRLRATWTVWLAAGGAGVQAFLRAADITSTDTWYAPVRHLPDLDDQDYLTQVRGTSAAFTPTGRALDGSPWPAPKVPLRVDAPQLGGGR